jgi:hypothetical protein
MEVYKSEYWSIFHEEELKLLIPVWNSSSSGMTEDLYKSEMENYLQTVEKYKPKQLLIDCREFYFAIVPEIQEWIDKNIFPKVLAIGVKYVAIVIPSEFIANLSVQQAMEEQEGLKFTTRYFDNREDAKKWIISM